MSRARDIARPRDDRPANRPYVLVVSTSRDVRRAKFAAFVRAALEGARIQRGWTVARVLQVTGVGKTTLYRWLNGEWVEDPEAAKVRDLCDGLDIPVEQAFRILWPSKTDRTTQPEPAPMDRDVAELLRYLADPATPAETREFIRSLLRNLPGLATRSAERPKPRRRRKAS
jgi:transcriptional regulator with XRE-family HTH domain